VKKNPFSFYLVIKIQNVSSSKLSSNKIKKENKYLFETHPALSVVDVEKQKQLVSQFFFFSVSLFLCFSVSLPFLLFLWKTTKTKPMLQGQWTLLLLFLAFGHSFAI